MTLQTFFTLFDARVRSYARRTARRFGLPAHVAIDLHQACYLAIPGPLAHWREDGGKSAFNWCASKMRQAMFAEIQRFYGNKPSWRREIAYVYESMGDREFADEEPGDLDLAIDLSRALEADRSVPQVRRFVRAALDPNSGEDMAVEENLSRQAINYSVRCVRKRMQKRCADLKQPFPVCRKQA